MYANMEKYNAICSGNLDKHLKKWCNFQTQTGVEQNNFVIQYLAQM